VLAAGVSKLVVVYGYSLDHETFLAIFSVDHSSKKYVEG
jgi:hypothetical protein